MKNFAQAALKRLTVLGKNLLESYLDNPVVTKLALMGAVASVGLFTPDQLAGMEGFIDKVVPVVLVVLGYRLRNQVTPTRNPKVAVTVPVTVPAVVPVGPSGAF